MVGKNIKRCRIEHGKTQDMLAEKLSVTHQAVSNWERGTTEPDIETLDRLAQTLDVSVEQLIMVLHRLGNPARHARMGVCDILCVKILRCSAISSHRKGILPQEGYSQKPLTLYRCRDIIRTKGGENNACLSRFRPYD